MLAMSVTYRHALLSCNGEQYADLFATPGGYFGSGARGEVRERKALIEMVVGYDRCKPPPAGNRAIAVAGQRGSEVPGSGVRGDAVRRQGTDYQQPRRRLLRRRVREDAEGWRFKSRNVISDAELAANVTTQDFIEIRHLAGDDHGYYDDLYGPQNGDISPRDPAKGADTRPFRTSGLKLTVTKDGVKGLAYLRNNGGHYEDLYVKTAQGWRIKERKYVPPAARLSVVGSR